MKLFGQVVVTENALVVFRLSIYRHVRLVDCGAKRFDRNIGGQGYTPFRLFASPSSPDGIAFYCQPLSHFTCTPRLMTLYCNSKVSVVFP